MRPKNGFFLLKLEPLTCSELVSELLTCSELVSEPLTCSELVSEFLTCSKLVSAELRTQNSELRNYGENLIGNICI